MRERPRRCLRAANRYQHQHGWLGFPLAVARTFGDDQAGNLAALIAYYAFFSLFPLLLVFVTALGFLLHGNPGLQQRLGGSALAEFPIVGGQIRGQLHAIRGSGIGLVVGVTGTLWGGLGVANAAQTALNTVWEVAMADRPNIVRQTGRDLLLLAVLGGGLLVTTVVNGFSTGARAYGLGFGAGARVLAAVLALSANAMLFTFAFRILTVRDVGTRTVLPGAILATAFWQTLQLVGGYDVAHTLKGANQTYGTFAVVIGLLSWLSVEAQLTLLAAEVNVVRALRLWQRSFVGPDRTDADQRAYQAYAGLTRYQREPNRSG